MADPLVSIICITYNHEPYIRQCLDGFMMQKTNFRFEVLIHDDASTDNTANIIREYEAKYPDIIKPIYQKENQYSKGVKIGQTYLYPNAKGKYIAECEGDDYWTDPLKLQKQVDVLEVNEDVGVVYTAFQVVDLYNNEIKYPYAEKHMRRSFSGDHFLALLYDNFPQTLTVLYRKSLYDEKQLINGIDYSLFLSLSLSTKFMYINEKTGVYRINPLGMMQSGSVSQMDFHQLRLYYLGQYFANKRYRRSFVDHLYICKYFLFHQCHLERYRKYQSLFSVIFDNNHIIKFLFPLGLISSSIVSIKQKYEKYD